VVCKGFSGMEESSISNPTTHSAERLRTLESFLGSDPDNEQLFARCAALAFEMRDFAALLRIAAARLRRSPADRLARAARARGHLGLGEYREAATILDTLSVEDPADLATRQDLGLCYFCIGEYAHARPALESVYRSGQRDSGLLRLLLLTYHHLGLLGEAAELAASNSAAAQSDAALAGAYALLYLDASRSAKAAQWAKTSLAMDPNNVDALTVQGTLLSGQGELEAAERSFRAVLERAPSTGRAWVGLGSTALLRQDFVRALDCLERGTKLLSTHVGSWHVLGWAYLLTNQLDGAERAFRKALELNRNFAETHGALAAVAALRGDRASAEHSLELALRLDPASLAAQFARAVIAGQSGDQVRARQIVLTGLATLRVPAAMVEAARRATEPATRH
jgi:tetratricopeptide (TPR) repeat protein